jgi:hypothetical protein
MKPAEIPTRLEDSSVTEGSDGSRGMTSVNHLKKAEQILKTCEEYKL